MGGARGHALPQYHGWEEPASSWWRVNRGLSPAGTIHPPPAHQQQQGKRSKLAPLLCSPGHTAPWKGGRTDSQSLVGSGATWGAKLLQVSVEGEGGKPLLRAPALLVPRVEGREGAE